MSKLATETIVRPVLTEKGTQLSESENKVFFRVARSANKIDVRKAVEHLYGVKVDSVRTQNVRGKWKRVGKNIGKRSNWKKAIVTLAEGSSIDFFGVNHGD